MELKITCCMSIVLLSLTVVTAGSSWGHWRYLRWRETVGGSSEASRQQWRTGRDQSTARWDRQQQPPESRHQSGISVVFIIRLLRLHRIWFISSQKLWCYVKWNNTVHECMNECFYYRGCDQKLTESHLVLHCTRQLKEDNGKTKIKCWAVNQKSTRKIPTEWIDDTKEIPD